jgi:hypothetical protein
LGQGQKPAASGNVAGDGIVPLTRREKVTMVRERKGVVMRLVHAALFAVGIAALSNHAVAQTPPTATEEFNLRIKCKQMADEKADSMTERPLTNAEGASIGLKPADLAAMNKQVEQRMANVIMYNHASNYDAKTNRCYIEVVKQWRYGRQFEFEMHSRQVYDAQTDDLLAFTRIDKGEKGGLVFDPEHRSTADNNFGFDDANTYMDEKMRARRK